MEERGLHSFLSNDVYCTVVDKFVLEASIPESKEENSRSDNFIARTFYSKRSVINDSRSNFRLFIQV